MSQFRVPRLANYNMPPPCAHKAEIECMLTALPCCCSCADKRPEATAYPMYIDGQGMRMKGRRWQRYCRKCYDHWQALAAAEEDGVQQSNATTSNPTTALPTPPSLPPSMPATIRPPPVFALGTREDVQQDDYESPIFGMFNRAWTRYRDAEEVRTSARLVEDNQIHDIVHNAHMLDLNANETQTPRNGRPRFESPFDRGGNSRHVQQFQQFRRRNFHAQFYNDPLERHRWMNQSSMYSPNAQPNEATAEVPQIDEDPVDSTNLIDRQSQRPAPSTQEDLKVDLSCKICQEQRIDMIVMPCFHAAMCHWCAELWKGRARGENGRFDRREWTCIVCRKQVSEQRRFWLG